MKNKIFATVAALTLSAVMMTGCSMYRNNTTTDPSNTGYDRTYGYRGMYDRDIGRANDRTMYSMYGLNYPFAADYSLYGPTRYNDSYSSARSYGLSHIGALMGLSETDANMLMDSGINGTNGIKSSYSQRFYGSNADINFGYDADRKVNSVTVTVDKADIARCKRELNARFGTADINPGTNNCTWLSGKNCVKLTEFGDKATLTFTKLA